MAAGYALALTYQGRTQSLRAWCRDLDLNYATTRSRLLCGWTVERAFTAPIQAHRAAPPPRPAQQPAQQPAQATVDAMPSDATALALLLSEAASSDRPFAYLDRLSRRDVASQRRFVRTLADWLLFGASPSE